MWNQRCRSLAGAQNERPSTRSVYIVTDTAVASDVSPAPPRFSANRMFLVVSGRFLVTALGLVHQEFVIDPTDHSQDHFPPQRQLTCKSILLSM